MWTTTHQVGAGGWAAAERRRPLAGWAGELPPVPPGFRRVAVEEDGADVVIRDVEAFRPRAPK